MKIMNVVNIFSTYAEKILLSLGQNFSGDYN
jgi:hypothetical protein